MSTADSTHSVCPPAPSHIHPASCLSTLLMLFFFTDPATTELYTLSLHDALPISWASGRRDARGTDLGARLHRPQTPMRSEEHTSELQSPDHLVCRLLLQKKKASAS